MRGVLRRHLLSLAALGLALMIGLVAIADHRSKQARAERAEVGEWFCRHQGTRCGGPSSARIERRWNERELGYEVALVLFAGAAAARVACLEYRVRR